MKRPVEIAGMEEIISGITSSDMWSKNFIAYLFLDNSNWLRNENNVKVIGIKQVIFHQTNLSCNRY